MLPRNEADVVGEQAAIGHAALPGTQATDCVMQPSGEEANALIDYEDP